MNCTIFLTLEPYLAQWLLHECDGESPIKFKKNSAESKILELYLTTQPRKESYIPQTRPEPGQITVVLPHFRYKDTRNNNYLPPRGVVALQECIRNRFRVELWKDLYTIGNVIKRTDISITNWMKLHGIVDDDRNFNTIAKILQRSRAAYCPDGRLTNHKSSKHCKK